MYVLNCLKKQFKDPFIVFCFLRIRIAGIVLAHDVLKVSKITFVNATLLK